MSKSSKGSAYEREICRMLSEWWVPGRDDIFWRSAASGGRATVRTKKGKSTFGQYGDITAIDPIGQPLTKVLSIECKRGYSKFSFADAIDRSAQKQTLWESFVEQAATSAAGTNTPYWFLIQRRDKRVAMVFFPRSLWTAILDAPFSLARPVPFLQMRVNVRMGKGTVLCDVMAMTLQGFLSHVTPEMIKFLA